MTPLQVLAGLLISAVLAAALIWVYVFAPIKAPWAEFGYYGAFNRVQRIIRETPDIMIVDSWQHNDFTLEDFRFDLQHKDGSRFSIGFYEDSPPMIFGDDDDIRRFIRKAVSSRPVPVP